MTIFAAFLLGALWCVVAGLFGFAIGKENPADGNAAAGIGGLMGAVLFLVTIGFLNHLTG